VLGGAGGGLQREGGGRGRAGSEGGEGGGAGGGAHVRAHVARACVHAPFDLPPIA
jgi:hypothetical protein